MQDTEFAMIFDILLFGVICWAGFHLVSRDPRNVRLLLAGCGLICYALGWGCSILTTYVSSPANVPVITRVFLLLFTVLAPVLSGISIFLPGEVRTKKLRCPLLFLLLFAVIGLSLLAIPQIWLQRLWVLRLVGLDLFSMGIIFTILDALDEGEALLPDLFRSFDFSTGTALLFSGQVAVVLLVGTGVSFSLLTLLLSIIATSIAMQTFSKHFSALVDRVAFAAFPDIQKARAELRAASSVLTRVEQALDLEILDEVEFTRLTRRALSHLGDLSRLASNPLTHLPPVDIRLKNRGAKDDALGRAIELKALLGESILRLKPQQKGDFGVSDEWRYYNALYFPYVMGIKPYSRRTQHTHLDSVTQKALGWFQSTVPQRTLHNWQNAATKLVAQDLREQSKSS